MTDLVTGIPASLVGRGMLNEVPGGRKTNNFNVALTIDNLK